MNAIVLEAIAAEAAPGLSPLARALLGGARTLPAAAEQLSDLDRVQLRSGPSWADESWRVELADDHTRWGADAASLASLEALRGGAACVVTGQQPGVLLGPLYTAYKILGAIALAKDLQRRHRRPVVAVYWCGGDDSDFDEVRRAWTWSAGHGPVRAELDAMLWETGQRVGSVGGPRLIALERAALEALSPNGGSSALLDSLRSMDTLDRLGDRAAAWALRLFAGSGLVVVDARSATLRAHGRPLFDRYRAQHRELTTLLRAHSAALRAEGWYTPLDDRALESGLFSIEGERRRKLAVDALTTAGGELAPSVLLRPLWQDSTLAPVAAVLGPSEIQYHVQIAPLYAALAVRAARPTPRPHLTMWPRRAPWIAPEPPHQQWLIGGGALQRAFLHTQLPANWSSAWSRLSRQLDASLEEFAQDLDDAPGQQLVRSSAARLQGQLRMLREQLGRRALQANDVDVDLAARWLAVRGVPQERLLAAPCFWWWTAGEAPQVLELLATAYTAAIDRGSSPTWVLRGGESW